MSAPLHGRTFRARFKTVQATMAYDTVVGHHTPGSINIVLDETPGVFLEGVTADDVLEVLGITAGINARKFSPLETRVFDALRKAAES